MSKIVGMLVNGKATQSKEAAPKATKKKAKADNAKAGEEEN